MNEMKEFNFLDGTTIKTKERCRGCFLKNNKINKYLDPIFENEQIIVSQDMEYPVPAFYIISSTKHISSIEQMDKDMRYNISEMIYIIRKGLQEKFNIKNVTIIQEEKDIDSHFHIWILPIWEKILKSDKPRIVEENILEYMQLFDFKVTSSKIIECNNIMKNFIKQSYEC